MSYEEKGQWVYLVAIVLTLGATCHRPGASRRRSAD